MALLKKGLLALVLFSFVALNACQKEESAKPASRELRVFTWSDYLRPEVISEFEKESGAKVILDFFSSNEEMLAKVQSTIQAGGRGYDLLFPSDYMVQSMSKLDLLMPLKKESLNFLAELDVSLKAPAYDPVLQHAVPFDWGTTGLAVNRGLLDKSFNPATLTWKDVFEKPELKGKVSLLDDAKEVLHAALMAQGKTWASAKEDDVKAAFGYLKAHKSQIKIFAAEARPILEKDECAVCQIYSGDAMSVKKDKANIDYVIPSDGATIWTDNLALPKNAQNVDLAYAFMNKIMSTSGARRFTEQTLFGSSNGHAMDSLSADLKKNQALFPSSQLRSRLEFLLEKPELLSTIDRLWTELKSQ